MPSGDLRSLALGLGSLSLGPGHACVAGARRRRSPSARRRWRASRMNPRRTASSGPPRVRRWSARSGPSSAPDFDAGVQQVPVVTRAHALGPHALDVVAKAPSVRIELSLAISRPRSTAGVCPGVHASGLAASAWQLARTGICTNSVLTWRRSPGRCQMASRQTTRLVRRGTFAAWRQVSVWELRERHGAVARARRVMASGCRGRCSLVGDALSRASARQYGHHAPGAPPVWLAAAQRAPRPLAARATQRHGAH